MATAIVDDLVAACDPLANKAAAGRAVYQLNSNLWAGSSNWNVDVVFGPPPEPVAVAAGMRIARANPAAVHIAIEIKAVMTEHRKAVKNRKRDLEAHHEHVHNYDAQTVAAGLMLINASPSFMSPLRQTRTIHGTEARMQVLLQHCVNEMRNVTESGGELGAGLDAKGVIVVNFDNINLRSSGYFTQRPAPQPGDSLHYDSFIRRLCQAYVRRFPMA